ncbi:MAG: transposase [Fimbriimonadia bacterium]|nr:transposase [Fimbriimonadia bacterium]
MNELPKRKQPNHRIIQTSSHPVIVFLTVCTKRRYPGLANERSHNLLIQVWHQASDWKVGRYVIMPDHLHTFVSPSNLDMPLQNWVRYWKSLYRRQIEDPQFAWQSSYWDTTLRDVSHYEEKWDYVRLNPVRHKMVENADDWRFQGELVVLERY